jgi:hypothetical protein
VLRKASDVSGIAQQFSVALYMSLLSTSKIVSIGKRDSDVHDKTLLISALVS